MLLVFTLLYHYFLCDTIVLKNSQEIFCSICQKWYRSKKSPYAFAKSKRFQFFRQSQEPEPHSDSGSYPITYSNFRSYSSAAISTTKQEPALCTKAPVVGLSRPRTDSVTAKKLIHMDSVILALMVLTVALDSRFR